LGALIPLVFVLGIVVVLHVSGHATLAALLPVAAVFFAVVAMVRAIWSRMNPWLEGFFISLGASMPVVVIAVVGHGRPLRVAAFVFALAAVCGAGAQTTRFLKTGRAPFAGATVAAFIVLIVIATKYTPMPSLLSPGLRTMDTPAPSLTLAMLDGQPVTLDSLKGRVVVLDFWATWCEPCMAEMPSVLKVHRRYQANNSVVFFAVNPGWEDDTADKIRTTARQKHIDIPIAFDPSAARTFNVKGLPTLIVIDRRGHIRMENYGYGVTEDLDGELSGQIDQALANGAR
jgi:thiol-disulfide isomerase/thioredoxin